MNRSTKRCQEENVEEDVNDKRFIRLWELVGRVFDHMDVTRSDMIYQQLPLKFFCYLEHEEIKK